MKKEKFEKPKIITVSDKVEIYFLCYNLAEATKIFNFLLCEAVNFVGIKCY